MFNVQALFSPQSAYRASLTQLYAKIKRTENRTDSLFRRVGITIKRIIIIKQLL